jgi:hypothetical protein
VTTHTQSYKAPYTTQAFLNTRSALLAYSTAASSAHSSTESIANEQAQAQGSLTKPSPSCNATVDASSHSSETRADAHESPASTNSASEYIKQNMSSVHGAALDGVHISVANGADARESQSARIAHKLNEFESEGRGSSKGKHWTDCLEITHLCEVRIDNLWVTCACLYVCVCVRVQLISSRMSKMQNVRPSVERLQIIVGHFMHQRVECLHLIFKHDSSHASCSQVAVKMWLCSWPSSRLTCLFPQHIFAYARMRAKVTGAQTYAHQFAHTT